MTLDQRDPNVPTIDDRPKRCFECEQLAPSIEEIAANPDLNSALLCPWCGPVHMECHVDNIGHLIHCLPMMWSEPLYVIGEGKKFRYILSPLRG